jgi:hypothetical protein
VEEPVAQRLRLTRLEGSGRVRRRSQAARSAARVTTCIQVSTVGAVDSPPRLRFDLRNDASRILWPSAGGGLQSFSNPLKKGSGAKVFEALPIRRPDHAKAE